MTAKEEIQLISDRNRKTPSKKYEENIWTGFWVGVVLNNGRCFERLLWTGFENVLVFLSL